MRGNLRKISAMILISTISLLSLVSCMSASVTELSSVSKNQMRVGIVLYSAADPFIMTIYEHIMDYADKEQELSHKQIVIEVFDSENNQKLQNTQIDQLVKDKYDAIAVNMVDRAEAGAIIDKVKEAKIPIVFFNREPVPQDMNKWHEVYYIGTHAAEAGKMQGQILLETIQGGIKIDKNSDNMIQYVMLEGEPGHQDSILRSYHSIKVLEDAGIKTESLVMDTALWQRKEAYGKTLKWLEQYGNRIEVILSNNDEMALGAIEALEAKGYFDDKNSIPVIGVDGLDEALQAITDDKMLGTVLNNADEQGKLIFGKLYSLITKEKPQVVADYDLDEKYIWLPHEIITKDTIK